MKGKVQVELPIDGIQAITDVIRVGIDKGTEHPVPAGQDIAVVTVRPRTFEMMMKLVHLWCNDDPAERPVQACWQVDIGVGKVGENRRNNPVKNVKNGWNADEYDQAKY